MSDGQMTYEETIAYSQKLRKSLVDTYTKDGMEHLVKDTDSVDRLLKALKDMDQTALADRKNNIDQQNANSSKDVADAMQELVRRQKNTNPFARSADGSLEPGAVVEPEGIIPKADPAKLGNHDLVEGEDEVGIVIETSADFMARMEAEKARREAAGEDV